MSQLCIRANVTGRVQGVGFRFHTAHEGLKYSLKGYAKNLPDGSVEIMACGEESDIDSLLLWLANGVKLADVQSINTERLEWRHMDGFAIK
ncbi:acylphosphatase [Photobacterium leiognathi]|uniref:acylphosphatase n=1 Tax=Photobacterium leiognathi TaxID=553611 RepID=UPI0029821F4B|nr:acylphosphatase [Photobacterium leiognathi]